MAEIYASLDRYSLHGRITRLRDAGKERAVGQARLKEENHGGPGRAGL